MEQRVPPSAAVTALMLPMKIIKLPLLQTLDYLEKIQKEAKNLQKLEVR